MFKVALALGMTVRELGLRMDSAELSEWLAYDRIDPIPDPWTQTGMVCSVLAQLLGGKAGAKKTPRDFIPIRHRPRRKPMGGAAIRALLHRGRNPAAGGGP